MASTDDPIKKIMPSATHPRLFRFQDNIGAIPTSFSRVIRKSVGTIDPYSRTIISEIESPLNCM